MDITQEIERQNLAASESVLGMSSNQINLRCIEGKQTDNPLVQEVWDRWKKESEAE